MKLRYFAIFIGIILIYCGLSWYIGWNGWILLSAVTGWDKPGIYAICIFVLAFAYILGRVGQSTFLRPLAEFLKLIGSYWFAVLEYTLLILPLANVLSHILKSAGVTANIFIVGVGSAAALLLLLLLLRGSWNAWNPIVRNYSLQIQKKTGSASLRKLRIAVASDIHLGTVIGNRHLERLITNVTQINPDLILLPGDILDDDIEPFLQKNMAPILGKLKAPLGVFAVTGNHEYIGKKVPQFIETMEAIGIQVLMDDAVLVQDSFYLIGRKDKASQGIGGAGGGRKPIQELVADLDDTLPLIMMDHQPSDLLNAAENGIDLTLSGHTHRGQMAPNHFITKKLFELDWGYKRIGKLHAVVSSGFGFWGPPVRIGSRSEVLHIEVEFVGAAN